MESSVGAQGAACLCGKEHGTGEPLPGKGFSASLTFLLLPHEGILQDKDKKEPAEVSPPPAQLTWHNSSAPRLPSLRTYRQCCRSTSTALEPQHGPHAQKRLGEAVRGHLAGCSVRWPSNQQFRCWLLGDLAGSPSGWSPFPSAILVKRWHLFCMESKQVGKSGIGSLWAAARGQQQPLLRGLLMALGHGAWWCLCLRMGRLSIRCLKRKPHCPWKISQNS